MSTVPFTVRFEPDVKAKIDETAKLLDRTPGYIVNKAIKSYLAAEQEKKDAITAAILQADAGEVVPEDAVDKWLDSLLTPNPIVAPKSADFR